MSSGPFVTTDELPIPYKKLHLQTVNAGRKLRVWRRPNVVCIDLAAPDEYSIGRPSVLARDGRYHMWYSYRGAQYRIGYAWSDDGVRWTRRDDLAGIDVSPTGWDSEAICYSHVFEWRDTLYMLYCGNEYGRGGLGLARFDA